MRTIGLALIAAGVLLALSQVFQAYPYQPLVAVGLALLLAGGLLICDHEPRRAAEQGEHPHGHHRH